MCFLQLINGDISDLVDFFPLRKEDQRYKDELIKNKLWSWKRVCLCFAYLHSISECGLARGE